MLLNVEASPFLGQAHSAAARASGVAQVRIVDEVEVDRLRDIGGLLIAVWGTSSQGAPIPADLLRSISHAGCNVSAAYSGDGTLCGAAVGIVSPETSSMYSLIVGVLPNLADSGVGFALKQHQRAWALAHGLRTMTWTFDPLVSRNARFNLTKLGAHASEYVQDFYGPMEDEINANDESDRLIAVWQLTEEGAITCSEGRPEPTELPDFLPEDVRALGPDGYPVLVETGGSRWFRVPTDIVALRSQNRGQAEAWRGCVREILTTAFRSGYTARGVTRSGWYRLAKGEQR